MLFPELQAFCTFRHQITKSAFMQHFPAKSSLLTGSHKQTATPQTA
jgi:hypothetical protein